MTNNDLNREVVEYLTNIDSDDQVGHLSLMTKRLQRLERYNKITRKQKEFLKNLEKTIDDYMTYNDIEEK